MKAQNGTTPIVIFLRALLVVGFAAAIVVLVLTWESPQSAWHRRAMEQGGPDLVNQNLATPMTMPPVNAPPFIEAKDANLDGDAEVIGVVVEDEQRAYSLQAMTGIGEQVVNDMFNRTAITVIHSTVSNYVRVFGSNKVLVPFEIQVEAYVNRRLHVSYRGHHYQVDDQEFPLDDWKFERTTWAKWRARYPKTLVYTTAPEVVGLDSHLKKSSAGPLSTWVTYRHAAGRAQQEPPRLTLRHPKNWTVTPADDARFRLTPPTDAALPVQLDVAYEELDESLPAQTYFKQAFDLALAKKKLPGLTALSKASIDVGQFPAEQRLLGYSKANVPHLVMVYTIWTDQGGCLAQATGSRDSMQEWRKVLQQICESVRIGAATYQ